MMYLEDFLEMAEGLPQDFLTRLREIRELDEKAEKLKQSGQEKSEKAFKRLAAKKGNSPADEQILEDVRKDFLKAKDYQKRKEQIVGLLYDVSDRHLRKLDIELNKYKMELEADNGGITEILERRALEQESFMPNTPRSLQMTGREKKRHSDQPGCSSASANATIKEDVDKKIKAPPDLDVFNHDDFEGPSTCQKITLNPSAKKNQNPANANFSATIYSSHLKQADGDNVIKREMEEGKMEPGEVSGVPTMRSVEMHNMEMGMVDMKNSYGGGLNKSECGFKYQREYDMNGDLLDSSLNDSMLSDSGGAARPSRNKKQTSRAAAWEQERLQAAEARGSGRRRENPSTGGDDQSAEVVGEPSAWNADPNEPRYCICNQVSYGAMVGCDNKNCEIEWFHYECVGVSEAPKGKWYCPRCSQFIKKPRRGR